MLDKNESALTCAKMNMELFGIFETKINAHNADIVDLWFPVTGTPDDAYRPKQVRFYDKLQEDLQLGGVDMIFCNPPWLPANNLSNTELESGVYDPKEQFLWSCLNFAKYHLSQNGQMLLVYSDLAVNLGL